MTLDDVGDSVSWGLAWQLVKGFMREWGTHTHAALAGWKFPATYGDVMSGMSYVAFLTANTEEKDRGRIDIPMPWPSESERVGKAKVSDEEREAAVARLSRVSAIPD